MDDDHLPKVIGEAARKARDALGLTQAQVAAKAGMVAQVYGRVERGHMMPSVPTLRRIAVALGTSPAELLGISAEEMLMSDRGASAELRTAMGVMSKWPASKVKVAVGMLRALDTARMHDE